MLTMFTFDLGCMPAESGKLPHYSSFGSRHPMWSTHTVIVCARELYTAHDPADTVQLHAFRLLLSHSFIATLTVLIYNPDNSLYLTLAENDASKPETPEYATKHCEEKILDGLFVVYSVHGKI